ncbi:DUF6415 family natural product biosynthesis protein [Streptomyces alanosinicus]|uniref:Uncharacterized protein n=1 Tax=Streptomyces alanosinicus TaxID=68171 RepID=A0A918YEP9_9ACTN|nr:DUF6415 family natural product biosynthesis protein [Streptomyces alanosinicus]GHE00354.1 hypothetical protein GCM10010339_15190 [Streptomyces alanosinicus]
MANVTASSDSGPRAATLPLDIATIRETAAILLGPDDAPDVLTPASCELNTLTAMLRGHLDLLIPEVKAKAERLPKDSAPRYCALACVGEATRKLRLGDGCTPPVRVAVARKLARCVKALCDHYENLRAEQP